MTVTIAFAITMTMFCCLAQTYLLIIIAATSCLARPAGSNTNNRRTRATHCNSIPRNQFLKERYHNYTKSVFEDFHMFRDSRTTATTRASNDDNVIEIPTGDASQECPSQPDYSPESGLKERSLCPWYSVVNHDRLRYPEDIVEARCRCTECINHPSGGCERVYYKIPVLRLANERDCHPTGGWYHVAVGCACAAVPRSG